MNSLECEVLSNLEAGRSMFRPRILSGEAQRAFVELMGLLLRLRREGSVEFPDARISKTAQGTHLAVGPVDPAEAGWSALARERRFGERPGRTCDRLWRLD
jgi:hypothetical protein